MKSKLVKILLVVFGLLFILTIIVSIYGSNKSVYNKDDIKISFDNVKNESESSANEIVDFEDTEELISETYFIENDVTEFEEEINNATEVVSYSVTEDNFKTILLDLASNKDISNYSTLSPVTLVDYDYYEVLSIKVNDSGCSFSDGAFSLYVDTPFDTITLDYKFTLNSDGLLNSIEQVE